MVTKAVRFSQEDDQLIKEFLRKNPVFDFSMLARTAILNFMQNPQIKISPVTNNTTKDAPKKAYKNLVQ